MQKFLVWNESIKEKRQSSDTKSMCNSESAKKTDHKPLDLVRDPNDSCFCTAAVCNKGTLNLCCAQAMSRHINHIVNAATDPIVSVCGELKENKGSFRKNNIS